MTISLVSQPSDPVPLMRQMTSAQSEGLLLVQTLSLPSDLSKVIELVGTGPGPGL